MRDRRLPRLTLSLFGSLEARLDDARPVHLRTRKAQALLALLALRAGRPVERTWLAGVLWPDSSERAAFVNLRSRLLDVRRALGPASAFLRAPTPRSLLLDLAPTDVDVLAFDAAIASGDEASLREAVQRYRGPLLEGCVEEWAFEERRAREEAYLAALERLATAVFTRGEAPAAVEWLRRAVGTDPLRESARRQLMRALAASGEYTASREVYRELRLRLHRELNTAPDAQTRQVYDEIRAQARRAATARAHVPEPPPTAPTRTAGFVTAADEGAADYPSQRSLEAFAHNLPRQLTSFIGREREMAEAKQLLATTALLTLTGSGGCGKTRLALQIAAELIEEFADGVWLVELAALADPLLVPQTVAAAFGVREEADRPMQSTVIDYLRPRSLLLLLDNCEHLLAACANLVESLLRACPRLKVLASSREGLGIAGECTRRVPSLSVPDPHDLPPAASLTQYEAVCLFVERAVLTQPSFQVTDQNAPAVAQLCHRLDGIPLAIELAAAHVKAVPVQRLNERLDDMFRLLTRGSRTALPRQQTLRATIDWSHVLLSPSEQALLRRLSVFAGGWTLEAAEAVCTGEGVAEWQLLDLLTSLVEKSLVVYEECPVAARYRVLEAIRQYARDRLVEANEAREYRQRHLTFFLILAQDAALHLHGEGQVVGLAQLEAEHDNLRTALEWSAGEHRPEALRLAGSLRWFWNMRGYLHEGRARLEELLSRMEWTGERTARATALQGAGLMAFYQGDFVAAPARFAESSALWRELGDDRKFAEAMSWLGASSEYSQRIPILEEALALAREAGDPWVLAVALWHLGANIFRFHGEPEKPRMLMQESAALFRKCGDRWGVNRPLNTLAWIARREGDPAAARALGEEALRNARRIGDKWASATSLSSLADLAFGDRDLARASDLWQESARLFGQVGDRPGEAQVLLSLGRMALHQDQYLIAEMHLRKACELAREVEVARIQARALGMLGTVAQRTGDPARALRCYRESLALLGAEQDTPGAIWILDKLGALADARPDPRLAGRLRRMVEALRSNEAPRSRVGSAQNEPPFEAPRSALRTHMCAVAPAEEQTMSLADAIRIALEECGPPTGGGKDS